MNKRTFLKCVGLSSILTGVIGVHAFEQTPIRSIDKLNTRTFLIRFQQYIKNTLNEHIFDPNDDITRHKINTKLLCFLHICKEREIISDFKLTNDESTNPPEIVDCGNMRANVVVKINDTSDHIKFSFEINRPSYPMWYPSCGINRSIRSNMSI